MFRCGYDGGPTNESLSCDDSNSFKVDGVSTIILRGDQVSSVLTSASALASVASAHGDAVFRPVDMAGLAIGLAIPFLIALVLMGLLLRREKKRFKDYRLSSDNLMLHNAYGSPSVGSPASRGSREKFNAVEAPAYPTTPVEIANRSSSGQPHLTVSEYRTP
jgi:hypothetical protein